MYARFLIPLALTALAACSRNKASGDDTAGSTECELEPEPYDPSSQPCTLTLQSENIPQVTINGEIVEPTVLEPEEWIPYQNICIGTTSSYSYYLPDQETVATTYATKIGWTSFLNNRSQPYITCDDQWYLLDSSSDSSYLFDEAFKTELETDLSSELGKAITVNDGSATQMEENVVWMPIEDEGSLAGVIEVNLRDQSYELIWSGEVYSEAVEGLVFDPVVQDQKFILKILQNYSELTHIAVFDLDSRAFEGLVNIDDTVIHYNDSTIEGVPFSDIEASLTNSYSNPVVVGDEIYLTTSPLADTMMFSELEDLGVHSQFGKSTLTGYRISTGESFDSHPLNIYGATDLAYVEEDNFLASVGYDDLYIAEEETGYSVQGKPTVVLTNRESGEITSTQTLADNGVLVTTHLGIVPQTYITFSDDGILRIDNEYFEYQEEEYVAVDIEDPQIEVSDFEYSYLEWAERGIRQVSANSYTRPIENSLYVYSGVNRDYVIVNTTELAAYYVQLPSEEPCYNFGYWDPLGYNADTGQFTGALEYADSCSLEAGFAQSDGENLYLGYGTTILRPVL